jgi:hypothetical protein
VPPTSPPHADNSNAHAGTITAHARAARRGERRRAMARQA